MARFARIPVHWPFVWTLVLLGVFVGTVLGHGPSAVIFLGVVVFASLLLPIFDIVRLVGRGLSRAMNSGGAPDDPAEVHGDDSRDQSDHDK